jgi:DNA-directed RNA polymerase specialized sigma24 family protein
LFFSCLEDELVRRRNQLVVAHPQEGKEQEHVTVPLGDVLRAVPHMEDSVRRAVVMHGLRHISIATTAKLLQKKPEQIPILLKQGTDIMASVESPAEA